MIPGDVIRVLIADDSSIVRRALRDIIHAQPDMLLIDEASTGRDVVRRATEQQPDIVLMDVHMPDMDGIQATWLVSSKVPHGAVIMVTSEERIDFLQKAMTAGAQGYVLKPFRDGAELLQTVRDAYARSRSRRTITGDGPGPTLPASRIGRRIAVFGAKGGTGKTTLAVGIALSLLQDQKSSAVLFDADFLFGDAGVHLDLPTERSVIDLLPFMQALDSNIVESIIAKHPTGLSLLDRPPRPEQADAILAEHVRTILGVLASLYQYVVIDTPPSYDERMLAVLDLADVYVVVLGPDIGGLRNTRHFLDVARELGYPEDRMCFVLNRANSVTGMSMDDIRSVLGTRRILQLPSAGLAVSHSINEGHPLVLSPQRSPFAAAIAAVAEHVRIMASVSDVRSV
jgi:pilus assembly protein CpaE